MKKIKIVDVRWIDSLCYTGWKTPSELREARKAQRVQSTVGYLIDQTKECLCVVPNIGIEEGMIVSSDSAMQIPRGCVRSIRELKIRSSR